MTRKQESPGISGCSREETWLRPRPGGFGGLLHAAVQRFEIPLAPLQGLPDSLDLQEEVAHTRQR